MTRLRLPALIDVHVHLREPGGEHKEDYSSGTAAALAGGVTCVLDMPNTTPPTTTAQRLTAKRALAERNTRCDVGIYVGAGNNNVEELPQLASAACALKIYVSSTFGPLRVDDPALLEQHFAAWPDGKPIVTHAEEPVLPMVLDIARRHGKHLHVAHVATRGEIELIAAAKLAGMRLSCEATPHHLFLTREHAATLGPWGDVRPRLMGADDVAALWEHLAVVDCIATDHAPHTHEEKRGDDVPPGLPGLETLLPLMLTAVDEGKLTLERLIELTSANPARIFGLEPQPGSFVEVEIGPRYLLDEERLHTRCGWTPFRGREVAGRVLSTTLRGTPVFDGERVLAAPGSGKVLGRA